MRITLLQTNVIWNEPTTNMYEAERLIAHVAHTDLFVLPEMWATGFGADAPTPAMEQSDIVRWMQLTARRHDAAVCGSVGVSDENGLRRNRLCFAMPDGTMAYYDKHHLFTPAHEDSDYTAGDERCVVGFRGVRLLLATCYDLRFPVWLRQKDDYDILVCVASWPESRRSVWDVLLKARALENQCYAVGCNRVGSDPNCQYNGGSMIVGPKGNIVGACRDSMAEAVTADADMQALRAFRDKFRVLKDRDNFHISTN